MLLAAITILGVTIFYNRAELVHVKSIILAGKYQYFLLGLAGQIIFYGFHALMYQQILVCWHPLSFMSAFRLTLISSSANKLVPSGGVSGLLLFTDEARSEGMAPGLSLVTNIWFYMLDYASFVVIVWWGLVYYLHFDRIAGAPRTAVLLFTLVFVISTVLIALALNKTDKVINIIERLISGKNEWIKSGGVTILKLLRQINEAQNNITTSKTHLLGAFIAGIAMQLTDALILYLCFVTLNYQVSFGIVIAGFGLASAMSLVSMVPQGIGIYETAMTWVYVQMGMPFSVALTVALLYRAVTFWFAIVPGLVTYRRGASVK